MFSPSSRYANAGTYQVTLADGTIVTATRIPSPVPRPPIGWHQRADGERLDLVAYQFLKDATLSWRLCDCNDAICPDALATHELIAIPDTGS